MVELLTINKHCREVTRIFSSLCFSKKSLLSNKINLKRASRLKSRTPSLRVSCHVCGWDTLVCQPHPYTHILQSTQWFAAHITKGEYQKKLRAIHCRKDREAKSRPAGIPILRSAATPNGIVTYAAQWTHCNRPFAKLWKIRPPGPTISEMPRFFSCCRFATPIAHFSKRSFQIVPGLI